MSKRDKDGNLIDFDADILGDISVQSLVGRYSEMIVQAFVLCLHEYYDTKNTERTVNYIRGMIKTTYIQCFTLMCVLEDMCVGLAGIDDIFNHIFGKDSDARYISDAYYNINLTESSLDEDDLNQGCQDERLKTLIGLGDSSLSWTERVGTEKAAWVAKNGGSE